MENCVIYSHYHGVDSIYDAIKTSLPKANVEINSNGEVHQITATTKGGLFSKSKVLKVNYRERLNPSYILDKVECGLTQNLAGMSNYISKLPTSNESVRQQLMKKVQSANCEIAVMSDHGLKPYQDLIHLIVKANKGFIFTPPNDIFDKSNGQQFLDESFNIIIAQDGQCEVESIDVSVEARYKDQAKIPSSSAQQSRKDQSNKH